MNKPESQFKEAVKALFIGGPTDGKRLTILDEHPYFNVPVAIKGLGIEVFQYRLVMVSNFKGLSLYADPKLTDEEIFRKLHEGYAPTNS